MTSRKIDHIVYCVPDLEKAIVHLHDALGVTPKVGGRHLLKGTKNALVNLGAQCYLEILAIDYGNKNISAPRWMGIDLITEPKITRWAIQSDNLINDQSILQEYHFKMGMLEEGQRKTTAGELLKWQMTLPLSDPEVELIPFMLSWSNSAHHPTDNMDLECSLQSISFYSKDQNSDQKRCFQDLSIDYKIQSSEETKIRATIEGPKGILTI